MTKKRTLEQIRDRIAEVQSELDTLDAGRRTRTETKADLSAWIDHQVSQVDQLAGFLVGRVAGGLAIHRSLDEQDRSIGAYLAWLDRDQFEARLHQAVDAAPDVSFSELPAEDRERRARELRDELAKLEREEEARIVEAEKAGNIIPRRPDVDPAAVLAVQE